jgi:hypothetical protein
MCLKYKEFKKIATIHYHAENGKAFPKNLVALRKNVS